MTNNHANQKHINRVLGECFHWTKPLAQYSTVGCHMGSALGRNKAVMVGCHMGSALGRNKLVMVGCHMGKALGGN